MRALLVGLGLLSATSLRVCGSDESAPKATASAEASVGASATASAALTPAKARIGGQVTVVANHTVELLLHQAGKVEAVVTDANGEATVTFYNANPKTKVRIVVQGITDKGVPVSTTMGYVVK